MMQSKGPAVFESLPFAFIVSACLTLYIEFLSKSVAGTAVSLGLAALLLLTSLVSLSHGIVLAWIAAVLIPEFPRDILDVYEALEATGSADEYNVLSSVKV